MSSSALHFPPLPPVPFWGLRMGGGLLPDARLPWKEHEEGALPGGGRGRHGRSRESGLGSLSAGSQGRRSAGPAENADTASSSRVAAITAEPRSPHGCQRPARTPRPKPLGGFLQPSLPRPQYVTWVTMAQVRASPSSERPGWSDPGKHKYKPIAKLRTMSEM